MSLVVCTAGALGASVSMAGPVLVSTTGLPGNTSDLAPAAGGGGANVNRFGFFSDLYFRRASGTYYGLPDRGPGGGVLDYPTRVEQFKLDVDPATGAASNFQIRKTIFFKIADGKQSFNGLDPERLNGNPGTLGRSFDPEGFVVAPNGNFYVSDEYGPSLYEFRPVDVGGGTVEARFERGFDTPDNVEPFKNGARDYLATPDTGRQSNRGFEGLAMSPDGSKLYAVAQSPLENEGSNTTDMSLDNAGRYSRNVRIVEFDAATGESTRQFVYQLEDVADINERVPGEESDFGPAQQGRLALSGIVAVDDDDDEFLILERDGRGRGLDNPALDPASADTYVGTKRVYRISLAGATDVSDVDLTGVNALPAGVTPVGKELFLDVAAALTDDGQVIPDKFEGVTVGPQLTDGNFALLLGTDNDFSVTQSEAAEQFDVYVNDGGEVRYTPIDDPGQSFAGFDPTGLDLGPLPDGFGLLPGYLYAFDAEVPGYTVAAIPLPGAAAMGLIGLAGIVLPRALRRVRLRFRRD